MRYNIKVFVMTIEVINMLKIGFTGTRHGMSNVQKKEFKKLICSKNFKEFHHGMCEGSDEQAHHIVEAVSETKIIGHPPKAMKTAVSVSCDKIMEADTFPKRNKDIVDSTDYLIATPDAKERGGSGTWKTIRYARKKKKRIYVIHKNGRVTIE